VEESLRVDVLLHRLCLTRSRSEAKHACDSGAVLIGGRPARASESVASGQKVAIRFPRRLLEIELTQLPPKSTSRKSSRDMYRVVRDEPIEEV
jgi:ribosomal 50S subunit-recycling heat shock protein